jgi:hypothetical protein
MTDSHDPWAGARTAQREEVRAIWAGRSAPAPPGPPRRNRRRLAIIVAVVLAVTAVIAFVFVPAMRDDADEFHRNQAAEQERLEAAERVRLRREGRPVRTRGPAPRPGETPLRHRARLVAAGEAAITGDARRRIASGELDGPVAATLCRPFPYTQTRADQELDPAVPRNRYQCIAYSRRFALDKLEGRERTGVIGQPYWLIVDYRNARMTFCKITPKAGEGGRSLATVPVAPACRDPLA